jgi:hypothetical protein
VWRRRDGHYPRAPHRITHVRYHGPFYAALALVLVAGERCIGGVRDVRFDAIRAGERASAAPPHAALAETKEGECGVRTFAVTHVRDPIHHAPPRTSRRRHTCPYVTT